MIPVEPDAIPAQDAERNRVSPCRSVEEKEPEGMRGKVEHNRLITGIVVPLLWDEDDSVVGVAISTPDEREYIVADNAKGEQLLRFLRARVHVWGDVWEDEDKEWNISVKKFEIEEGSTFDPDRSE